VKKNSSVFLKNSAKTLFAEKKNLDYKKKGRMLLPKSESRIF
jgi:hypothetical protein